MLENKKIETNPEAIAEGQINPDTMDKVVQTEKGDISNALNMSEWLLKYSDEYIENPDGIKCRVLKTEEIDFTDSYIGRKSTETLVLKANGNEKIETINWQGLVESIYVAQPGEAIFCNSETDKYVPRDANGQAWMFDEITRYWYEITENLNPIDTNEAIKIKSNKLAQVLPNVITAPTCIKDAWGKGSHQFLFEGATLKKDMETGKVTGIEKEAFDKTWEIISKENTNVKQ